MLSNFDGVMASLKADIAVSLPVCKLFAVREPNGVRTIKGNHLLNCEFLGFKHPDDFIHGRVSSREVAFDAGGRRQ
ncbi:hypothetical protein SCA6_003435 [Theobroma cacao]